MYIQANGKIYTAYFHALERMRERGIYPEWIELAMNSPDDVYQLSSQRWAYDKDIDNRALRIVVDEYNLQIVTVYWLD